MKLSFWLDDKEFKLNLEEKRNNNVLITLGKKEYLVSAEFIAENKLMLQINGRIYDVYVNSNSSGYYVYLNGKSFNVERKSVSQILGKQQTKQKKRDIKTSMPGRIVKVLVQEGDNVKEGQAVLILEAMKMENEIKSPQAGKITRLIPQPGEYVETGSILFSVE